MKNVREGYKTTELGEIPVEWEVKSIGCIGKIQGGYAFKSEDYKAEGVKLIRITNVQQCNLNWEDKCFLPKSFEEKFQDYSVKVNDVVLAMTRPIISTGIKACKVKKQDVPSLLNQRVGRFIISNELDSGFLYQYIFTDYFVNKVNELSSTTGQPNISSKQIESIMIAVPLIKEQQKISLILSSVDEEIEITDNIIEKTKELKKGLIKKLLTKGIEHSRFKDTEIGMIPEEWEFKKIKDVSSFCSNGFVGTASPFYTDDNEGIPYLMSNNVRANKIDERSLVKISIEFKEKYPKSTIYEGDMLTVQSGHIGTSCIVPQRYNNTNCHALIITRFNKAEIEPLFISYYINSSSGLSRLSNIFVGTTIKHVNVKDLIQFYVPVPPLEEQKQIASILSSVDEKIDQYESKKEKLQELKKGLMQKLLTGKIRVMV